MCGNGADLVGVRCSTVRYLTPTQWHQSSDDHEIVGSFVAIQNQTALISPKVKVMGTMTRGQGGRGGVRRTCERNMVLHCAHTK